MSIDTGRRRTILAAAILSFTLVLAASAACPKTTLNVRLPDVTIDTPGALTPGTGVVMSVRVHFPDKEDTTFPVTSQLELTSGLDSPYWTWTIIREGISRPENQERKSRVVIGGSDLSYPANTSESLEIRLYGTAPSVMENKELIVMRIQDIAGMNCIENVYRYDAWVLNTTMTRERVLRLSQELALLRADAAARQKSGGNTTGVMEKIGEAQQALDTANATPAMEFVSVSMALNRTEAAIVDGRRLLETASASGTTVPLPAGSGAVTGVPGTPQQTPASPEPVLMEIAASAGVLVLFRRRERL